MEPHPQMNITFLDVTGLSTEEIETLENLLDPENSKSKEAVELPWELECGRPVLQPSLVSSETEGEDTVAPEPFLTEPLLYSHHMAPPPYSPPEVQFYPPYLFGVPQFVSVKNPYWSKGRRGGSKHKMAWEEEVMPYEMPSFVPPFSYPQHLVYMPVSYPIVPMMTTADETVDPSWSTSSWTAPDGKKGDYSATAAE